MKLRLPRLLALSLWCLSAALLTGNVPARADDTPAPLIEQSPAAPVTGTTPASQKGKGKGPKDPNATAKPQKQRKAKEIQFPLPIGEKANGIRIPKLGLNGELLQQIASLKMWRKDDDHVVMNEANIDLFHPDGKEDFHVILPEATLDLKTNMITSDHPVTIKTDDFELTGERMQFNTVEQTGELQGHVHMVIRNFKQVANIAPQPPAP